MAYPTGSQGHAADGHLTWGLCVPTLNRIDVLEECLRRALAQTRPPAEIAVVDASAEWQEHKCRIESLFRGSDVRLHYFGHEKKSSAAQRNIGIAMLDTDIVFILDDDALMQPGCAEAIMRIYQADGEKAIAGICATNSRGEADPAAPVMERKNTGWLSGRWVRRLFGNSALVRWVVKEILMSARERIFIRYDDETRRKGPAAAEALGLPDVKFTLLQPGWGMTVRRELALREPFDDALLAYCPTEDLDASYRWGRYGVNLVARRALLNHVEVAAGRIKRREATMLSVMNSAYFTRKNSRRLGRHIAIYYVYAVRRLIAEALKDGMTGRLTFPQLAGMAEGVARSPAIFRHDRAGLEPWYEEYQRRLLARRK